MRPHVFVMYVNLLHCVAIQIEYWNCNSFAKDEKKQHITIICTVVQIPFNIFALYCKKCKCHCNFIYASYADCNNFFCATNKAVTLNMLLYSVTAAIWNLPKITPKNKMQRTQLALSLIETTLLYDVKKWNRSMHKEHWQRKLIIFIGCMSDLE